jgi:hypothetical protein
MTADTWSLWCADERFYTTTDPAMADAWVAADPAVHRAMLLNSEFAAIMDRIQEDNRELFELLGRGGWTGKTGLEVD